MAGAQVQPEQRWRVARGVVAALYLAAWFGSGPEPSSLGCPPVASDCPGYVFLMGTKAFSPEFVDRFVHNPRGFTVPTLYWLMGSPSPETFARISRVQSAAWGLGWLALCWELAGLAGGAVGTAALALLLPFAWAAGYWQSANERASDAFGFAFSFLFAALCLLLRLALAGDVSDAPRRRRRLAVLRRGAFVLAFGATALLSFRSRDSNFLLGLGLLPLALAGRRGAAPVHRGWVAACALVLAVAVGASLRSNPLTRRHMGHVVASVGLADDELFDWFVARGAPLRPDSGRFSAMLPGERVSSFVADRDRVYNPAFYGEEGRLSFAGDFALPLLRSHPALVPWLQERARPVYAAFLATHPEYVLRTLWDGRAIVFAYDYAPPRGLPDRLVRRLPTGNELLPPLLGALALLAMVRGRRALRDPLLLAGAVVTFGGLSNAAAAYLGDVWELAEMGRHALLGSLLLRAGATCCLAAAVAGLVRREATPASQAAGTAGQVQT